jgi:diacylglycerol kinase (ATP)
VISKVALAVNPTAGQGRGRLAGIVVAARLRAAGVEVEELAGKDAEDLRGQVRTALRRPLDALVVVGGDGMVHLGVGLVAETVVPLGIVAVGTGNDVARALGLPIRDALAGADLIVDALRAGAGPADSGGPGGPGAGRRSIDAIRCTPGLLPAHVRARVDERGPERWFAGVLGAGFDAVVNERANGWSWPRGRAKYVLAMLRELPVFRPRRYAIDLDGQRWDTAAMLVAVANGPSYGGGMRVAPDARLDDGLLDVMVVAPLSRFRFLSIFPRVYAGTHVEDPRVSIRQGRTVTVDAPGIVAYADGERIGPLPLTCELIPAAVIVLTPRAAETPGR